MEFNGCPDARQVMDVKGGCSRIPVGQIICDRLRLSDLATYSQRESDIRKSLFSSYLEPSLIKRETNFRRPGGPQEVESNLSKQLCSCIVAGTAL